MDAPPASALAAVAEQLERLQARGARAYDTAGCDCVRALIEHAEQLGGEVGERLAARARVHLAALDERFERDRQRVAGALERAEGARGELPELRRKLEAGELVVVARALRRLRCAALPVLREPGPPGAARSALSRQLGVQTGDLRASTRRRRQLAYEDSVAQLVASLALARATDGIPADAGPYNPLRIASEVLDGMRAISPFYLTVQLNRLEELASLLSLPELPAAPAEKALPKRPAKARKR